MSIIISDQLVGPPSWFASFRDLTLYCDIFMEEDVVVQSSDPDTYWRWMKPRGGMDFVQDFVRPGSENGIHLLAVQPVVLDPSAVVVDRIVPENFHHIAARIRSRREPKLAIAGMWDQIIKARIAG